MTDNITTFNSEPTKPMKKMTNIWLFILLCLATPMSGIIGIFNLLTNKLSLGTFFYIALTIIFVFVGIKIINRKALTRIELVTVAILAIITITLSLFAIAGIVVTNVRSSLYENSATNTLNENKLQPYVSSEFGFTVTFPGFPTTTHSTENMDGISIPTVQYMRETSGGTKAYMVQVADYPVDKITLAGQERGALDAAINGMVGSTEGSRLVSSSNNGQFHGFQSADAEIAVGGAGDYTMLARHFIVGNRMYSIITGGTSKGDHDNLVGSFRFN